jgi:ATP-dependent helicase/nuclease subunit B
MERPRGLVRGDHISQLDARDMPGWSSGYNVFRKADGLLGRMDDSDAVEPAAFTKVLNHVQATLGVLADGILDGKIPVRPYRLGGYSPCSWCPMAGICRFEMGVSDVRFLDSLKRSEVFRQLSDAPQSP